MTSATDQQLLELYKQSVEMADRVSSRRGTANAFFVSVNAAFATVLAWMSSLPQTKSNPAFIAICGVGVLLSFVWWLQLRSYRDLNKAKFLVILELEKNLVAQPFEMENSLLPKDKMKSWRVRYAELGWTERKVPWLFVLLYIFIAIWAMCG